MRLSFLIAAGIAVALFMSGGAKGIGTQAEGIVSGCVIGGTEGISNCVQKATCSTPTVTAVAPNSGPAAGGTSVTVSGTGFTGATGVNFGSLNPAAFTVTNSTAIAVASSPAGSAGTIDVQVTTPCGTSAISSADHFTYTAPGCAAATAYLARTTEGATTAGYLTTFICGLIAAGDGCSAWSGSSGTIDALYVFTQDNSTDGFLNLCSTNYGITNNGATYANNAGLTGNGSSTYADTNLTPSTAVGLNYATNSAAVGAYVTNNRTTGATYATMGDNGTSVIAGTYIYPRFTDNNNYMAVNDAAAVSQAATTVRGMWINARTASTTTTQYLNGVASGLAGTNPSFAVSGQNTSFVILARRAVSAPSDFSADTVTVAFISAGVNSTVAASRSTLINNLMTSQGINVY